MPRISYSTILAVCMAVTLGAGCSAVKPQSQIAIQPIVKNMQITSPAFAPNRSLPSRYTCDGENSSPPLEFSGVPTGTVSLVLIMEDPDVPKAIRPDGMWDHWVVFNIPPQTTVVAEAQNPPGSLGVNTRGNQVYGSPCPPSGQHRYFFKLFALDSMLDLPAASTKVQVESAMQGHVLDQAELIGLYQR